MMDPGNLGQAPFTFEGFRTSGSRNDLSGVGLQNPGTLEVGRDLIINHQGPVQTREDELLDSLHFPELQLREHLVEPAHNGTCNWLRDAAQYRLWQESDRKGHRNRLLWIKGKAGSGKSTLMLHELSSMRQQSRGSNASDQLILSHFFNARGTGLEMTAQGLYRTLLYQVLKKYPQLCKALCIANEDWRPPTGAAWPVPHLLRLLSTILSRVPCDFTVFFVDAVDECMESEIADMIYGFDDLVKQAAKSGKKLRVCFASRHSVNAPVDSGIFLTLEDQASHQEDMAKYIRGKLHIIRSNEGPLAEEIRSAIEEKASGVFLWVKLVVESLNRDYRGGRLRKMRERLVEISGELQNLCLEMVVDCSSEQIYELLMAVRVLLFSKVSEPEDLWWTVQLCLERPYAETSREYMDHQSSTLQNWISNISRGLMKCKDHRYGTAVQFIHETVRRFATSESGLLYLFGVQSQLGLKKQARELLRDGYAKALQAQNEMIGLLPTELLAEMKWKQIQKELVRRLLPREHDNIRFAASGVLNHAEALQRIGVDQESWMAEFTTSCGLAFALFHKDSDIVAHPDSQAFIINALIIQHCDHLIRHTQLQPAREARAAGLAFGFGPRILDYRYGDEHSMDALVDVYLRLDDDRPAMVQTVLEQLARTWRGSRQKSAFVFENHPLARLCYKYNDALSTFFLLALAVPRDIDATARANNVDLDRVVEGGFFRTLRFFMEHRLRPIGLFDVEDEGLLLRWVQEESPVSPDSDWGLLRQDS